MEMPSLFPETIIEVIESLRDLRGTVPLPENGSGWRTQPEAWYRLVGQICAVGSSRAWEALQTASARESLSIPRIRSEEENAPTYVHTLLSDLKIRYCSLRSPNSAKADAIAANAHSEFIADPQGTVWLLDNLQAVTGPPNSQGLLTPDQARTARRLLIRQIRFFGPKSASDFLLGLGLANSLLAFDVRLLNLLIDCWGLDPAWRNRIHRLSDYELLEDQVIALFCQPLAIQPVELDQILFYGYPILKKSP